MEYEPEIVVKAEQLAKGAFWFNYMNQVKNPGAAAVYPPAEPLDSKTFTMNMTAGSADSRYNDTKPYNAVVTYQKTF